jgi:hypothetical protein
MAAIADDHYASLSWIAKGRDSTPSTLWGTKSMDATFSPAQFLGYLAQELVDQFGRAGGATTSGLVGSAREVAVRKKLQMLLPEKVTVASGCVIDSYGSSSNQTDVLIHERDNCPVFSINDAPDATYVPCEGTVAVGEIKSTLNRKELNDSVAKIQKIKGLRRAMTNGTCFRHYGTALVIQGAPHETYDPENKTWDQIYGFILCQKFGLTRETLAKSFAECSRQAAPHLAPSMLLSLADGVVMFADQQGALLRNARGAKALAFFNHPGGDFQFLLSEIAHCCNGGRTTDVLPYARYLLGSNVDANVVPTYIPI